MSKPIKILRCKDAKENHYTKKGLLFDLPMRILCVGKSQFSGKSSFLLNILCQDDPRLYKKNFEGDNIYIFSGSLSSDNKIKDIINQFEIPSENCNSEYSEDMLEAFFDLTEEEYNNSINEGNKPKNTLVLLDDVSYTGNLKKKAAGILNKVFCNGRHINLSICVTAQKYAQLHTTQRENCTGCVVWGCSEKQLEQISDDHNTLGSKKQFRTMFREVTSEPHSGMIINYSNNKDSRYMNLNFEPIGPCGKVKGKGCPCK